MFCENCGKENPAGALFCEVCGTSVAISEPAKPKKKKTGLIIGIIALLLVIAAAALYFLGVFKAPALKAAEKYNDAYLACDAKTVYSLLSPYYRDTEDDDDAVIDEIKEDLKEEKEDRKEKGIEKCYYRGIKVIKKYTKSEVKKIEEYLEKDYGCDPDAYKLQDVQVVKLKYYEKLDDKKYDDEEEVVMIKIKNKWYVENRLYSAYQIRDILKDAE